MLVDPNNPFIQLLQLLGCDLTRSIDSWTDVVILAMAFIFGCIMLIMFCKFLYGMMCRFFRGRF